MFNHLSGARFERSSILKLSINEIKRKIITTRDKLRQKCRDILYTYIMNYYVYKIDIDTLLRIEKFGQYLSQLDETEHLRYIIINIWNLQFIIADALHAKLRREFLKLITYLQNKTKGPSEQLFQQKWFMFMESFVRAALYVKIPGCEQLVDKQIKSYPSVDKID